MSDVSVPRPDLDGVALESSDSDYTTDGFHHRHVATPDKLVAVAEQFRANGYYLEMITCEDQREENQRMRLVYTYNRFDAVDRHVVATDLPPEIPGSEAPSITDVYPAADWFEREAYDMYGVRFANHPDLKRILLPDDSDFHALLKDFGRVEDAPDVVA